MLPNDPNLCEALDHLEVFEGEPATRVGDVVVAPKRSRQLPNDQLITDRVEIVLRQTAGPISAARLAERVADALHVAHHPHVATTDPLRAAIAAAVLAITVLKRRPGKSTLEAVNDAIRLMQPTRVHVWAIMANLSTGDAKHHFGDFVYGRVDLERLRACCERAGSDYFELYGQRWSKRRGVQRSYREVLALNHNGMAAGYQFNRRDADNLSRIVGEYYGAIAHEERRHFMIDLDRQQAVYGAAGLGAIPSDTLRRSLTHWVVVFTRRARRQGWVIPEQQFLTVVSTEPMALSNGLIEVRSQLRVEDWGRRPLDSIVQRFCEYRSAAEAFERDGMLEEALLHSIFGLDLLLGGEAQEALTVVLSERVAILVHVALGCSIPGMIKFIRDSYNMRSGYAHRGQRGEFDVPYEGLRLSERLKELGRTYRAIFGAACFARLQPWTQDGDARSSWVRRVDILRAKHKAGMALATSDLQDLGLDRVRLMEDGLPAVLVDWSGAG